MSFDAFEQQARLYIVGALEPEEFAAFETARRAYGARAEACINDFRRLNAAVALTLHPHAPRQEAKEKLLSLVQETLRGKGGPAAGEIARTP